MVKFFFLLSTIIILYYQLIVAPAVCTISSYITPWIVFFKFVCPIISFLSKDNK